jgi:hypothetical protein
MNIIKSIFGGGPKIVCPRCLERITVKGDSVQTCANCGWRIPVQYVRTFDDAPPIFIQVFGWTNHGKTLFLDTLRLVLIDMHALWDNFRYQSFTQLDMDKERELQAERRKGVMAPGTQRLERDQNEVYIMNLRGMERWGNRMLVIMDHPGEYFERYEVPVNEIPFLINTPTTVMLISLPDVIDDETNSSGERIDQLFQIYLAALENEGVDWQKDRRKLVIVFTKADITQGLPSNLRNYLMEDAIWSTIDSNKRASPLDNVRVAEYLERMQRVSDDIRHWIRTDRKHVPGGANFVNLIDDYNIDARFTMMSATGGEIEQGGVSISPRRVLDPFFWALEFQSR